MFDVLVFVYENYWRGDACPNWEQLTGAQAGAHGFARRSRKPWVAGWPGRGDPQALIVLPHAARPAPGAHRRQHARIYSVDEQNRLGPECLGFMLPGRPPACCRPHARDRHRAIAMASGADDLGLDDLKIIILMVYWSYGQEPDADPRRTLRRRGWPPGPLTDSGRAPDRRAARFNRAGARVGLDLGQRVARGAHGQRLFLLRRQQARLQVSRRAPSLDQVAAAVGGREQVELLALALRQTNCTWSRARCGQREPGARFSSAAQASMAPWAWSPHWHDVDGGRIEPSISSRLSGSNGRSPSVLGDEVLQVGQRLAMASIFSVGMAWSWTGRHRQRVADGLDVDVLLGSHAQQPCRHAGAAATGQVLDHLGSVMPVWAWHWRPRPGRWRSSSGPASRHAAGHALPPRRPAPRPQTVNRNTDLLAHRHVLERVAHLDRVLDRPFLLRTCCATLATFWAAPLPARNFCRNFWNSSVTSWTRLPVSGYCSMTWTTISFSSAPWMPLASKPITQEPCGRSICRAGWLAVPKSSSASATGSTGICKAGEPDPDRRRMFFLQDGLEHQRDDLDRGLLTPGLRPSS